MFDSFRKLVLRMLRVPAEPDAPFGEPASIRVFRASRKLYWLRMIRWSVGQTAALIGIVIWLSVVATTEDHVQKAQADAAFKRRTARTLKRSKSPWDAVKDTAARMPRSLFNWLWVAEGAGLVAYAGQLAMTYIAVRLDYEMRWYLVTDRSLRIRSGLWKVQEMTMSFANLQQVMVSQGPLQRLLGIADVRVQSAGGGGGGSKEGEHGQQDTMHTGVFHGVEQAVEIRDLILKRLRQYRESGLGDPDELNQALPPPGSHTAVLAPQADLMAAAHELLSEARELRRVLF